jgi:adenylate cyclase
VVVMFADLRGFTTFSENRLPYDVVFLLNRYFRAMGEAIESSGGHLDKFIGDGIMALFGLDDGPEAGARNALRAARRMIETLEDLNRDLAADLAEPLRIGIGIHAGGAIVGDLGYGTATSLTAIGDVVNTASRLESASKEFKTQLIASEAVLLLAGIEPTLMERHNFTPRGRVESMDIGVLRDTNLLPT